MNKEQTKDFLAKTNTTINIEFLKHDKHFVDDKKTRDIYKVTLKKDSREYIFNFGNSINDSYFKLINTNTGKRVQYRWDSEAEQYAKGDKKRYIYFVQSKIGTLGCYKIIDHIKPTEYDILACLSVDYSEDFGDFCLNYGYNEDSIKALNIYNKVKEETKQLKILYNDKELELLNEVQ